MGLDYNDLSLLRFIQRRQRISLSRVAQEFQKNEISIRREIEHINLYSSEPMIQIKMGYCISQLSYQEFVGFVRQITMEDYSSSYIERIRVMVITIFFNGYINASSCYQNWGLSLTTKKKDTAQLRSFLLEHGLLLTTLKKKGLAIEGDELQLRFLVIDILHPLLEFTTDNHIEARYANTPLEKQSFDLANTYLQPVTRQAVQLLNQFLERCRYSLNYPSKKFLLLFICIMHIRPVKSTGNFTYRLPFAPLDMHFTASPQENKLYNVALSMMNFSHSLKFPFDRQLWFTTEQFVQQVVSCLKNPFPIREEMIDEFYNYFYREITLDHFHLVFVDKTVEYTYEQFTELYQTIGHYGIYFKAAYHFTFADEHISTLTLLVQKYVLRNQVVDRQYQRVVIVTSINFERISFFLEQISEFIALKWIRTLNINEIHQLEELDYDYIFCFSSRIFNLLSSWSLPVLRMNFFVDEHDLELLLSCGFTRRKHRFLTAGFVSEIGGKSQEEMAAYLKENYRDYFV